MKRWLHIIWFMLGLCPRLGHRWNAWKVLPSGLRKGRICQACAEYEVDPPFPKMDRKEVKKALAKRLKRDRKKGTLTQV